MLHRVPNHAIYAGSSVNLLDPIGITQCADRHLPRCRLLARTDCGESEHATCTQSENTADDSWLTHANAHHLVTVRLPFQELHHDHVVVKIRGGGHHLEDVGRKLRHLGESLVQFLCGL